MRRWPSCKGLKAPGRRWPCGDSHRRDRREPSRPCPTASLARRAGPACATLRRALLQADRATAARRAGRLGHDVQQHSPGEPFLFRPGAAVLLQLQVPGRGQRRRFAGRRGCGGARVSADRWPGWPCRPLPRCQSPLPWERIRVRAVAEGLGIRDWDWSLVLNSACTATAHCCGPRSTPGRGE